MEKQKILLRRLKNEKKTLIKRDLVDILTFTKRHSHRKNKWK